MNKQTYHTKSKQTKMATAMNHAVVSHNRRQRLWGVVALIGLFLCGYMLGGDIKKHNAKANVEQKQIAMTTQQCETLAQRIINVANGVLCGTGGCVAEAKELNGIYSENCAGRIAIVEKKVSEPVQKENNETDSEEEFKKLSTCQQIEILLSRRLYNEEDVSPYPHINNAKIYANLSERGCPENSQKYVDLARQELQIARALEDDDVSNQSNTIEIVETYKRLQMQNAAQEILDKAKRITNPAIDFIIELEKIINE